MVDTSFELALARPIDAVTLGQMSRDLVEEGLKWSWKPSRILKMIQHPDSVVLVARTRIELAGFAIMEFHDTRAHLNLLAVKPGHRRKGIGKAMIEWLEQSCQIAGIAGIYLELRSDNNGARQFYESLGFQAGETVEGYYQGRVNALTMIHHLMTPDMESQRP